MFTTHVQSACVELPIHPEMTRRDTDTDGPVHGITYPGTAARYDACYDLTLMGGLCR